ncbi:hypothetical protein [Halocynthiibacter namhaensis]|uniref:hypothetical protein n=1 Tax=Halocynthiibacter namhaensis TaxID=1290553 RepID=UPI00057994A0|nr:hypothetical protein [Halocynthiibacter namhaensis]
MVEYYVILRRAKRHAFKFAVTSLTPHLRCWARLALSTSALAFAFASPGWSANECGPDASGQGANDCGLFIPQINNGITYLNSDGITLDLNNSAATITRAAGGGIAAIDLRDTDTGTGDLIVNATDFDRMSNFQRGIFILKAGVSGDTSVTLNNGTIQTINGQTSSHGAAIYMAPTATGNASITVDGGTIITDGLNSAGLSINNAGQGNASIVINGGQIESRSTANPGAISMVTNLTSTASSSIVMNDGDVRTGIGSAGLNSGGIIARNLGLGTAHAEIHAGTVAVRGAGLSQGGGGRDAWLSLSSGVAAVIGSATIGATRPQNATNTSLASALMTGGHITVSGIRAVFWRL